MIHDILISLLCCDRDALPIADFLISEMSDIYLHPAEKNILKNIIAIGNKHRDIKKFILQYCMQLKSKNQPQPNNLSFNSDFDIDEPLQKGLYLQAITDGMGTVLQSFSNAIVSLEERYLKTPNFTLLFIYQEINTFEPLFTFLLTFINDIKTQRLHGCTILQYLHKHNLHGNDKIMDAVRIIQQSVLIVFFKQLSQWLIYGNFADEYGEFFIQHIENKHLLGLNISMDKNNRGGGGVVGGSGGTGRHTTTTTTTTTTVSVSSGTTSANTELWHYEICYDLLPQFCSTNLAEKILFIGQTVLMFHSDSNETMKKTSIWNPDDLYYMKQNDKLLTQTSGSGIATSSSSASSLPSLWNDKEYIYFNKFYELQLNNKDQMLNGTKFEQIINEIKICVTERLSEIAINQADLMKQLRLIKEFYLLGRGELFLEFIKQIQQNIINNNCINENTVRDISKAFQNAASSINIIDDLEQFSIYMPMEDVDTWPFNQNSSGNSGNINQQKGTISNHIYDIISLKYKVKWPLHLLFSPKVIDRYNEMFRFLIRIKKIQHDLNMVWCQHREKKTKKNSELLQFRNKLIFLMHNLQYYLQVDVLESQFSILANIVQTSKDFEHIQRAHTIFQANILSLCFLLNSSHNNNNNNNNNNNKNNINNITIDHQQQRSQLKENPVLTILNSILLRISQFCEFSLTCSDPMTLKERQEFESCENLFSRHVEDLLKLLIGLKAGPSSAPLSQFLLRLDYNYWFSSQKPTKMAKK